MVLGSGAGAQAAPTAATPLPAHVFAPYFEAWNGGIGTYIKSSAESNADVGDKANDAIRVNGEGQVVEGYHHVNQAAFAVHAQVHRARPDVVAVAHTH
ncbi:NAD-glutamate dehydrogenase domain-containing protein, partial [Streptomyces sp. JV190]|uniref:NAD-glutamate dehydrogenase domain-containing protein n=1 Tax=Streptomyces sp. JV190 TaxID=3002533 RepID=UPI002E785AF3